MKKRFPTFAVVLLVLGLLWLLSSLHLLNIDVPWIPLIIVIIAIGMIINHYKER